LCTAHRPSKLQSSTPSGNRDGTDLQQMTCMLHTRLPAHQRVWNRAEHYRQRALRHSLKVGVQPRGCWRQSHTRNTSMQIDATARARARARSFETAHAAELQTRMTSSCDRLGITPDRDRSLSISSTKCPIRSCSEDKLDLRRRFESKLTPPVLPPSTPGTLHPLKCDVSFSCTSAPFAVHLETRLDGVQTPPTKSTVVALKGRQQCRTPAILQSSDVLRRSA
jgi:hypothetical protein